MITWQPDRIWMLGDHVVRWLVDRISNHDFLRAVTQGRARVPGRRSIRLEGAVDTLDWIGVNYYQRYRVGFKILNIIRNLLPGVLEDVVYQSTHPGQQKGPGPWGEIHPEGLYEAVRSVMGYGRPIYITENGIPDAYDEHRPRFILLHLKHLWRAMQEGAPVRGYYHWSLVDNFEWDKGYDLAFRFGLYGVDFDTQERIPRTSSDMYGAICKAGGINRKLAERYAPGTVDELFAT